LLHGRGLGIRICRSAVDVEVTGHYELVARVGLEEVFKNFMESPNVIDSDMLPGDGPDFN
jgi:hypothetical protein